MSYEFKLASSNSRETNSIFGVMSSNLRLTSSNLRVMNSNPRVEESFSQ